ncbi:acyl-CoA carboxylase epsilon subunit [Actinomadura bangladeshensis]|uniref:Acyl-CoA carboxylase subunit epsilon n=2 Tax=Actinomadura bangladeshensis TaxID=453573 RepID=A0A4R4PBA5_9ACTN|nr:acyl-CoA carboxylase epsilon subunit [Actinomadura bangladeshensis]TDC19798.1 acyl-CoA carboxylase subunit epsilon [Actinomadura bangladeshensis]
MSAGIEIVRGRLDERELAALVAVLLHEGGGRAAEAAAPHGAERRPGPRWDPEGLSPPRPASAPPRPRTR